MNRYIAVIAATVAMSISNSFAQPIRFKGSAVADNQFATPRTQAGEITFEGEYANDITLPLDKINWQFDISTDGQSVTIHDMTAAFQGTVQINPFVRVDLDLKASITQKTVDINPSTSTVWKVQQHEFTNVSVSGIYHGLGLTKSFSGILPDTTPSEYELGNLDFFAWPNSLTWKSLSSTTSGVTYPYEYRSFESSSRNGWIGVEPYLHVRSVTLGEPLAAILTPIPSATDAADFNLDGAIDGADFLKWQRDDGSAVTLDKWKTQFGTMAQVAAVPEPAVAMQSLIGALSLRQFGRKA